MRSAALRDARVFGAIPSFQGDAKHRTRNLEIPGLVLTHHPGMTAAWKLENLFMDDQQRRDEGMVQRRKVLGDAWVDKSLANRNSFNTEFQDLITRQAWGEIWTRPHFDHRTRRVLVIGTMVALGQWDEFRLHVRAALSEGGFTPDDIKEILLQQAIYCGVPAANHAVKEASAIVAELGLLKK